MLIRGEKKTPFEKDKKWVKKQLKKLNQCN